MDEIQNLENIARLSSNQEFIIHLKFASYDVRGETHNRFNIVSIFDVSNESERIQATMTSKLICICVWKLH